MTLYEAGTLVIQSATLIVLYRTLVKLRQYTDETKRMADLTEEQLPRPCVLVLQNPDSSDDAIVEGQGGSIAGSQTLRFKNVGTAPAIAIRYQIQTTQSQPFVAEGFPLAAGEVFVSTWARQSLSDPSRVIAEFESLSGARYQTETVIESYKWIRKVHVTRQPNTAMNPPPRGR